MDILTNEQCCEVIGWKYRPGMPIYNGLRPWQGTDDKWHALPDFRNSLDDCFKWLVPWLEENGWSILIKKSKRYYIAFYNVKLNKAKPFSFGDNPSIAFVETFTQMVRGRTCRNASSRNYKRRKKIDT